MTARARFASPRALAAAVALAAVPAAAPAAVSAAAPAAVSAAAPAAVPRVVVDHLVVRKGPPGAFRVDLPYPQLAGVRTPAEQRIDGTLRAAALTAASNFEAEARQDRPSPGGPGGSGAASTLGGVVTTDLVSASTVALTVYTQGYIAGAAHGFTTVTTFDLDAATGREIPLASLFRPGAPYLEALSRASRSALHKVLGQLTVAQMLDPGTAPRAANFSAFALTPWGLRLTFQEYQVAPYAAGTTTITLPYASLASLGRPGGPMAAAAAHLHERMALLPATSPPVVEECSAAVHYAAYVVPEPARCGDGALNTDAWDAYAVAGLRVLALPAAATLAEVRRAMCADDSVPYESSALLELHAEALAALYHGWRFGAAARTGFPGACHPARRG